MQVAKYFMWFCRFKLVCSGYSRNIDFKIFQFTITLRSRLFLVARGLAGAPQLLRARMTQSLLCFWMLHAILRLICFIYGTSFKFIQCCFVSAKKFALRFANHCHTWPVMSAWSFLMQQNLQAFWVLTIVKEVINIFFSGALSSTRKTFETSNYAPKLRNKTYSGSTRQRTSRSLLCSFGRIINI